MQPLWKEGAFQITLDSIEKLDPPELSAQVKATWLTYVGRQDRLDRMEKSLPGPDRECLGERDEEAEQWVDADQWISRRLSDHRVVMFNENHFRVEARAFVLGLLPRLKDAGFTHIGFEAFQMPDVMAEHAEQAGLDPWRYSPSDGGYTHEPLFAALVRQSDATGLEIFGYEISESPPDDADMAESIAFREQGQADNLASQIDAAGEDARVAIFAGWSHIAKEPLRGGQRWMAARFREQTGIDPLSVDLTTCMLPVETERPPETGRIPLDADGAPIVVGQYRGAVDAQVHLPAPAGGEVMPGFHRQALGVATAIPAELLDEENPVLVRALREDRASDAVPDDQVLVYPGELLSLYLPAGHSYRLVAHLGDGSVIARKTISVE
ncbi:hypothetical protein IC757_11890 [Wenzhouxiangella sp. AB-CW3]|uniref:hypothetical protein n=1 Tax=Wenzhouxiangella sp. AB-CW3 TaxID=2771012 RepID=UPI00168B0143|nr:hypothetical protein [Wenzhouxiangella sp. AB-CW3]QOC21738.1 hypothetical protein IC757_11890 [Wenzhouxiangella sp. AB-CW3]